MHDERELVCISAESWVSTSQRSYAADTFSFIEAT